LGQTTGTGHHYFDEMRSCFTLVQNQPLALKKLNIYNTNCLNLSKHSSSSAEQDLFLIFEYYFNMQVSVQVGVWVSVWLSVRVSMRVSVWVNLQVSACVNEGIRVSMPNVPADIYVTNCREPTADGKIKN
jgi:hypothetical protein